MRFSYNALLWELWGFFSLFFSFDGLHHVTIDRDGKNAMAGIYARDQCAQASSRINNDCAVEC